VLRPVRLLTVRKSCLLFSRGSCRAELTRTEWVGQRALSIAIKDTNQDSAIAAVRTLGLDRYMNLSCGDVLWPRRLRVPFCNVG